MSLVPPGLALTSDAWAEVQAILQRCASEWEVWAFGSRTTGKAKPYSDLHLALITPVALTLSQMATLQEAFDASDLTFRVDLVDWAATSDSFRQIIAAHKVVVKAA